MSASLPEDPKDSELPQLEAQLVWASGYWDGPMSGLCRVGAETLWFSPAIENDDPAEWYCRFWLHRLPPASLKAAQECHDAFRLHVGAHYDYDSTGNRDARAVRPQSEHHKFYDAFPPDSPDPQGEIIGWFEI